MFAIAERTVLVTLLMLALACGGEASGTSSTPLLGFDAAGTTGSSGVVGSNTTAATGASALAGRSGAPPTAARTNPGAAAPSGSAATRTGTSTGAAGASADMATAGMAAAMAGASAASPAAAGSGSTEAGSGAPSASTATTASLPRVMTTDGPGPFTEVVKVKNTPPGGWLVYPKEIGKDGIKHPLFVFGPGGGTTPDTYEQQGMHWDRYGSYGFVIYVLPMSTGDGSAMKAGLDWLIMQNDDSSSPLYQKLDTAHVCAAGHSMGSITTFDFMPDDRVTTTIHISGGSFDGMGPSHLKSDTMFLCGPDGSADMAEPQCETDFMNSTVPTFYTKVQGSTHITSGRLGWASVIAWMLWHLAGQQDQWEKEFLEPTGQFQMGIYKSQIKNW